MVNAARQIGIEPGPCTPAEARDDGPQHSPKPRSPDPHRCSEKAAEPSRAALAGAAPVSGEAIHLTNSHWSFHTRELCQAAGLEKIHVLNDFEVLAPCP